MNKTTRILFTAILCFLGMISIAQETPPAGLKPVNAQFYINLVDSAIWHLKGTPYGWERLSRYRDLKNYTTASSTQAKLDSIYARVVNLYDNQTINGIKTYVEPSGNSTDVRGFGIVVYNADKTAYSQHGATTFDFNDPTGFTSYRQNFISYSNGPFKQNINFTPATGSNKVITFPDKTGTIALTSDFAGIKDSTYNAATYQSKYVFNPKDYGGVGDGVANDGAAMQATINAAQAVNGQVVVTGKFNVTGTVLRTAVNSNISFVGVKGNYSVNPADSTFNDAGAQIFTTSATDTLIVINGTGTIYNSVAFLNKSSTRPTAGVGIAMKKAGAFNMYNCVVKGFYRNMDIIQGVSWSINSSLFINPTVLNLHIQSPITPDQGDHSIMGCSFLTNNNADNILFESSGGLKVINSKFQPTLGNGSRFGIGIEINLDAPGTSDIQINNNSFEGYNKYALYFHKKASSTNLSNITITANQITPFASCINSIKMIGVGKPTIVANVFDNRSIDINTNPFIQLDTCNYITVLANGWGSGIPQSQKLSVTNMVGVYIDTLTTPAYSTFIKNTTVQEAGKNINVGGGITSGSIPAMGSASSLFLVSNGGRISSRTAANMRSDLSVPGLGVANAFTSTSTFGAGTATGGIPYSGGTFTPTLFGTATSTAAGVSAYYNDGTNNRRAGLYVDGAEWGLSHLWSTSALPFVIRRNTTIDLKLSTAGLLQLPAYTSAGVLVNDASGNITSSTAYATLASPSFTGTVNLQGLRAGYKAITSATTFGAGDFGVNVTSGTFTQPLPATPSFGMVYAINNTGTGVVTVTATSIAGLTSVILSQGEWLMVQYTGVSGTYTILSSSVNSPKSLRLTGSGTGAATTISIPHGLTGVTAASIVTVQPINAASQGVQYVTADATNINIVYSAAPVAGTNNLSYNVIIKP